MTDVSTEPSPPNEGTPLADSSALLWEEARRQIVRQEADLDNLRNRATALLSVSSIVAAIFGAHVGLLSSHPSYVKVAIGFALAFLAASVALVIAVLSSREGWNFSENLSSYFPDILARNLTPLDVTYNLAKDTVVSGAENQTKLTVMHRLFKWSCVFAGLQVVAWGLAVAL